MTTLPSEDAAQLLTLLPLINKTVVSRIDLKGLGYTRTQLYILLALARYGNLTMTQVCGYISSSKEQATRAVAPLVDSGLVERYVDPANRTRIHIRLTPEGADFLDRRKRQFCTALQQHMEQTVTTQDLAELRAATGTLIRILSKFS